MKTWSVRFFTGLIVVLALDIRLVIGFTKPSLTKSNHFLAGQLLSAPTESISTQSSQDNHDDDNDPDKEKEEAEFIEETKLLSNERNLHTEKVLNARDLSTCKHSPIQPGRIFRTGRLSDASEEDIELLMETLQLKTLIDLRSPTELSMDPTLMRKDVFGNFTNVVWRDRGRKKDGCIRVLKEGEFPVKERFWKRPSRKQQEMLDDMIVGNSVDDEQDDCDCDDLGAILASRFRYTGQRKERIFVSLMNEFKYVKGTLSKLRKRDIVRTLFKSPATIFSRRARTSIKKPFLREINGGGLQMLNELLFRYGSPGIKFVLEVCADKERHPIAFYCTAGKDRTGAISAIILALCGVSVDDIVEDYSLSANVYAEMNDHQAMVGALSQRSLDPKVFLGAPPEVMRSTLVAINKQYGSVEAYCDWIGFGPEQRRKLRHALLK